MIVRISLLDPVALRKRHALERFEQLQEEAEQQARDQSALIRNFPSSNSAAHSFKHAGAIVCLLAWLLGVLAACFLVCHLASLCVFAFACFFVGPPPMHGERLAAFAGHRASEVKALEPKSKL